MKRLSLAGVLLLFALAARGAVIFEENFNSLTAGTEVVGTVEGWNFFNTYEGTSTVVPDVPGCDGNAMKMVKTGADYDMVFTPKFDMSTANPIRDLVRVSATMIPSSAQDIFALYAVNGETNRFCYIKCDISAQTLSSSPDGATLNNLRTDGTPNTISLLWDNYDNTIRQITCNGLSQDCHIKMNGTFYEQPVRLRLSTQFTSKVEGIDTYYDDVKVETEPRFSDPHIFVVEDEVMLKKAKAGVLTIYNAGPDGELTYTVQKPADADWLTVSPATGTFSDSKELVLTASGTADYKRTQIAIDCGDGGQALVNVIWQNGRIFYYEDFETPFMELGDLQNQGGWLVRGANCSNSNKAEIEITPAVGVGQCMHAYRATGYDGIRRGGEASSPAIPGCPDMAIVKVSTKIYWDSTTQAKSIYLATPAGAKPFCMKIKKAADGKSFYLYQMMDGSYTPPSAFDGKTWPMDEWVDVSYTLDFLSRKGVSVSFNEDVADISTLTLYGEFTKMEGLSFCTDKDSGGDDWDAKFYFDDVTMETLPRGDEPSMAVNPAVIHTGASAETSTFDIVNAGGGSFDYAISFSGDCGWLSADSTSGTCEGTETITLTIDRASLSEGYHKAIMNVDGGEAGSARVCVTASNGSVFYAEDFETPFIELGDMQGQDGWTVRDGGDCKDYNEAYVVDAHGSHCLNVLRAVGTDGIRTKQIAGCPDDKLVKFSCDIYWDSNSEAQSVYIATPAGMKPFCMKIKSNGDGTFYLFQMLDGSYDPPLKGFTWPMDEWVHVTFTLDFRAQSGVTVTFNEDEGDISTLKLYGNGGYHKLQGFSFCTDGSGHEFDSMFYYDNLQAEVVERANQPKLVTTESAKTLGFGDTTGQFAFSNGGGGTFNWTATVVGEPAWCELTKASGVCEKDDTLTFKLNRDEMGDSFYRTVIHLDAGEAGEADLLVSAASGNVFYFEDFESPFMEVGDLHGQDSWTVRNGSGCSNINEAYVTNGLPFADSACMHAVRAKGYDGIMKDNIGMCPENSRVRISMDVYWDGESPCDAVYLASSYWSKPLTLKIENRGNGLFGVRGLQDDAYKAMEGYTWSKDEWVHISYVIDFRTYTAVELTIGDVTQDITYIPLRGEVGDHKKYKSFAFCTDGSDDVDFLFYFDNLKCEVVPKETEPRPVFQGSLNLGVASTADVTVLNYGTACEYSVRMLEMADKVTVSPAKGSLNDSVKLTATVDRSGLEDAFHRARMVFDYSDGANSGAVTALVTFSKGGWYYATDFLGPFFQYGELNGQDTWTAAHGVNVVNLDGENAITFPGACRTSFQAQVPAQAEFTFSCRIFSEELADDSYLRITSIDDSGFFPIYVSREGNPRELQVGYFQNNTWTPVATAPFDQWNDFSFTMNTDVNVASLTQLTWGDFTTNFAIGDIPLNPKYDEKAIDQFVITCNDVATPSGISVARILVHDSALPEPALAALVLLALAFLAKRR